MPSGCGRSGHLHSFSVSFHPRIAGPNSHRGDRPIRFCKAFQCRVGIVEFGGRSPWKTPERSPAVALAPSLPGESGHALASVPAHLQRRTPHILRPDRPEGRAGRIARGIVPAIVMPVAEGAIRRRRDAPHSRVGPEGLWRQMRMDRPHRHIEQSGKVRRPAGITVLTAVLVLLLHPLERRPGDQTAPVAEGNRVQSRCPLSEGALRVRCAVAFHGPHMSAVGASPPLAAQEEL